MRFWKVLLCVLLVVGARAQETVSESEYSKLDAYVAGLRTTRGFECYARALPTRLSYAFRFQPRYTVEVPTQGFEQRMDSVHVLARVAPAGKPDHPVYLLQNFQRRDFPIVASAKGLLIHGSFFAGEGDYDVDLVVYDNLLRVWRKRLRIKASRSLRERKMRLALEPGAIQPLQLLDWTPRQQDGRPKQSRLTVLFHAASLYGSRITLDPYDVGLLLSSLSTTLSECAFADIRLVAFNLDQQRELFRRDHLDVDGFRELARTLLSVELAKVPMDVLQHPRGQFDLLSSLLRSEFSTGQPSDTILFFGPYTDVESKWKRPEGVPSHTRLIYFQHRVDRVLPERPLYGKEPMAIKVRPVEFPDTIEHLVKSFSGEVLRIHDPAELSAAIAKLNGHIAPEPCCPKPDTTLPKVDVKVR